MSLARPRVAGGPVRGHCRRPGSLGSIALTRRLAIHAFDAFQKPARPAMPEPTPSPTPADADRHREVAAVLERIRPAVQADGGDIELVGVTATGRVEVRFQGACVGCPSSSVTLHHFIERFLLEIDGIREVVAVP